MKETDQARQAFEDYWSLGPSRSLPKLAAEYRQRAGRDEAVPTRRKRTIFGWSVAHNWQARLIARIDEEEAEVRKKLRERSIAFRERLAAAIEVDVSRLLDRLAKSEDGEMLAESAADVERLGKLFFQLTGQPLADRSELTGAEGKPLDLTVIFGNGRPPSEDGDDS